MRRRVGAAVAAWAVLAAGCGPKAPEIAVLSGKVTIDGKPVKAGTVNVASADDVTRTSGDIQPDGSYSIIGAPVGPVRLSVSTDEYKLIHPEPGAKSHVARVNPLYTPTPARYEKFDTAGLAHTVPRGTSTFDIALTSK